jgi:RHS repeat-associated protein
MKHKSLIAVMILATAAVSASKAAAVCAVPTSVYGYTFGVATPGTCDNTFKTLEEAELSVRTSSGTSSPAMELAFPLPSDLFLGLSSHGSLDYRPFGAASDTGSVLIQAAQSSSSVYKLYTEGWPPAAPHASCQAEWAACSSGNCATVDLLANLAKCEFDNTWNLQSTPTQPAFCWMRQGEPTRTSAFTSAAVIGAGQTTGALLYRPSSSIVGNWGSTIGITATACAGTALAASTSKALTASQTNSWNVEKTVNMTCPSGTSINSAATSADNACKANFTKALVQPPTITQTPAICGDLNQSPPSEGNPCFPTNGNKAAHERGFEYGRISLQLHYNSLRQTRPYSYIDRNWSHSFAKRILTDWSAPQHIFVYDINGALPSSTGFVTFQDEMGLIENYKRKSDGSAQFYSTSTVGRVLAFLPRQGDLAPFWEMDYPDGTIEIYDVAGRLTKVIHPDSPRDTLVLSYLGAPLLSPYVEGSDVAHLDESFWRLNQISDGTGRSVSFQYTSDSFMWLTKITADNGATALLTLGYDTDHRLTSLTYADNKVRTFVYNEAPNTFLVYNAQTNSYVSGPIPSGIKGYWLTGIVDERNRRYATYQYDDWGRAIASWHGTATDNAGGVRIIYASDSSSTVMYASGYRKVIDFAANEPYRHKGTETEFTDTSTQVASTSYQYYPGSHRLSLITQPNTAKTLLEYEDTDGVHVVRRTEALLTPAQRRTEMDWDPGSNRLKARRVYADPTSTGVGTLESMTTFKFNLQDQVVARCEHDPLTAGAKDYSCIDTGVAPVGVRRTVYAYCPSTNLAGCPAGYLQSIDGPRTDVADVRQMSYYDTADTTGCANANGTGECHAARDLKSVINALNQKQDFLRYDRAGRVTRVRDPNGTITDLTYSPRGWVQTVTVRANGDGTPSALDATTRLDYDDAGLVQRATLPDQSYLQYTYDDAQRLTDVTDAGNNALHFTLDADGHRVNEVAKDPAGVLKRSLGRVYNSLGQLLQIKNASNQVMLTNTYDASHNLDLSTDSNTVIADRDYDPLNRLMTSIQDADPAGNKPAAIKSSSGVTYDTRDNVTSVKDPKGLTTNYTYDGLDNLTRIQSPDTGVTSFGYDAAGNRTQQVDARGLTTTYGYDALNRRKSIAYKSTPSLNVTFYYDELDAVTGCAGSYPVGRLTRMTDSSGSTTYCYDRRGNVVQKSMVVKDKNFTVKYEYTLADRLYSTTYPSGAYVVYDRNAVGQISGIRRAALVGSTLQPVVTATYNPFGPLSKLTYANGRTLTKNYDQNYWIQDVTSSGADGLMLHYGTDVQGTINHTDSSTANARTYGYDGLYHLKAVTDANGVVQESYDYDPTGDRKTKSITPPGTASSSQIYGYATDSHRLNTIDANSRAYDSNGNTVALVRFCRNCPTFQYDDRNRMASATTGINVISYNYNGIGQRTSKTGGGNSINRLFIYDESGNLLGEYSTQNASAVREVIYLGNLPVATTDAAGLAYIETDHLGTPRALVDATRNVIRWKWDPLATVSGMQSTAFGENLPAEDPDGDGVQTTFNLRFPGQYYDAETGLIHNGFRDYDPATGRYVESDPIGLRGGVNTFAYAFSQPHRFVDQLGLDSVLMDPQPGNLGNTIGCIDEFPIIITDAVQIDLFCPARLDCVKAHEQVHLDRALSNNPDICKGNSGIKLIVGTVKEDAMQDELNAYSVERECLFHSISDPNKCKSIYCEIDIKNRIDDINRCNIPAVLGGTYWDPNPLAGCHSGNP